MIKVIIEMHPHGVSSKSRVIASGIISLQDTETFGDSKGKKGDYEYNLSQHERNGQSAMWKTWATGNIKNFPRMQKNAWYLLYLILKKAYEK